jgi:hypothetical protein
VDGIMLKTLGIVIKERSFEASRLGEFRFSEQT